MTRIVTTMLALILAGGVPLLPIARTTKASDAHAADTPEPPTATGKASAVPGHDDDHAGQNDRSRRAGRCRWPSA